MSNIDEKVSVYITPTNCCNLVCRCPNASLPYRNFLEANIVFRLLEEIASDGLFNKMVTWSEFGESFLHKDNFDFIKFAKEKKLNIYLLTNLTLLSPEEIKLLSEILSSGDLVCLNLDWGKKVYETIRKNTSYEKKLDDILKLILLNKNKNMTERFKIEIWSIDYDIVSDQVRKEFFEEIKYLSDLYQFSYSVGRSENEKEYVDVSFHSRAESNWKDFLFISGKPMCAGLEAPQLHILPNGRAVLCCHDWKGEVEIGNVKSQSLREIWESQRRIDMERSILERKIDTKICRQCLRLSN